MQVTGGGGYTKENVARCWTVETGVLLDTDLPNGMVAFCIIHFSALSLSLSIYIYIYVEPFLLIFEVDNKGEIL